VKPKKKSLPLIIIPTSNHYGQLIIEERAISLLKNGADDES